MMNSRSSLCVTTALAGGVLASLFYPAAARAQCVTSSSSSSQQILDLDGDGDDGPTDPGPADDPVIVSNSIAVGSVNALSSAVTALTMNDSAITAQGSSPFVVANPTQAPNRQGGGVWVRGVGGNLLSSVPAKGVANAPASSVPVNCPSRVRQGFAGVQAGVDVANLNLNGIGGTLNVGLTSGYMESSAATSSSLTNFNFKVPFVGLYTVFNLGSFFADAQFRGNFFRGSVSDSLTGISGLQLNANGFTLSGNIGYHYLLPLDWFIEPSAGVNWSRTVVDPMNFAFKAPFVGVLVSNTSINDFDNVLGRASARVGTTLVNGQLTLQPFFTASVFHEFAGPIGSTLTAPTAPLAGIGETILSTSRIGTFGQFGVGIVGQIANSGLTGFVRSDYRTGSRFQGWSVAGGVRYTFDPEAGVAVGGK